MVREQLQVLNALDATKMQWYHFMAIVIAGMGFFTDAYHLFCIFLTTKVLCFFTGAYHDLHQFMMFLVSEPLFSTLLLSYLALVVIVIEYPDATPRDVKFSVKPSSKGRSDIQSGSDTIRVPKCFSEHHPLIQLVLLAEKKWASFYYPKALAPKCVVLDSGAYDTTKPDTDTKSSIESCTVSLETLRTIAGSFHGTDSCSTMQNQLNVNNPGHEHNNDPRSNGASEITSSLETTLVPVVNEHGETEMEYYSNPDTVAAESGVIKADEPKTSATWVLATAALHHATADRALLSSFVLEHGDHFVHVADGSPMQVLGRGNVVTDVMVLPDVWYVPGLTANLVSVSQLAELDYSVEFGRGACYVRSAADCRAVGAARAGEDGLFEVDYLKVPFSM